MSRSSSDISIVYNLAKRCDRQDIKVISIAEKKKVRDVVRWQSRDCKLNCHVDV